MGCEKYAAADETLLQNSYNLYEMLLVYSSESSVSVNEVVCVFF